MSATSSYSLLKCFNARMIQMLLKLQTFGVLAPIDVIRRIVTEMAMQIDAKMPNDLSSCSNELDLTP